MKSYPQNSCYTYSIIISQFPFVAIIFSVTKTLVHKLVKQYKTGGNLEPLKPGKPRFSHQKKS